jgi:hypothetical protein
MMLFYKMKECNICSENKDNILTFPCCGNHFNICGKCILNIENKVDGAERKCAYKLLLGFLYTWLSYAFVLFVLLRSLFICRDTTSSNCTMEKWDIGIFSSINGVFMFNLIMEQICCERHLRQCNFDVFKAIGFTITNTVYNVNACIYLIIYKYVGPYYFLTSYIFITISPWIAFYVIYLLICSITHIPKCFKGCLHSIYKSCKDSYVCCADICCPVIIDPEKNNLNIVTVESAESTNSEKISLTSVKEEPVKQIIQ